MSKPWISDARQRASKKYRDLHRELAIEVAATERRKAMRSRSDKQVRHMTQAENFRLYADTFA